MTPARAALDEASGRLRDAGIAEPRGDAQLLLCASLSIAREALIAAPGRCLDAGETEGYRALVDRRCAREPVSRILGKREFWSLEFGLCPATLDPRPDSETVIEAVLAWQPDREAALRERRGHIGADRLRDTELPAAGMSGAREVAHAQGRQRGRRAGCHPPPSAARSAPQSFPGARSWPANLP